MTVSRREFLAITAAAAVGSAIPRFARAAPAKWHRLDLSTAAAQPMLASYQIGITKMLQLPPTDPRNWYRNAFIHTLDCPHGNWWFPPWHRGYIGWFEETIRSLCGNPNFALPFWDWTKQPFVPPQFWQGVLNPSNPAYIASYNAFYAAFKGPMNTFWNGLTAAQKAQLHLRGYNSVNDLWAAVQGDPMFFPPAQARTLTQANPNFNSTTKQDVSLPTIQAALAPKVYTGPSSVGFGFGSGIAPFHSDTHAHFSILEGQPHNNVHDNVGGFMQDFLSPVDPIFFMHHANIDRLWDVWTRKQQKLGLATLPVGADLTKWQNEPFLFYINSAGQPVAKNTAGAYATIDGFDYDYALGSGDSAGIAPHLTPAVAALSGKRFAGTVKAATADSGHAAQADVAVTASVLDSASSEGGVDAFAVITINPPANPAGAFFHVLVNSTNDAAAAANGDDPSHAATVAFFGHHAHGPAQFAVPLTPSLKALRAANRFKPTDPLHIHVLPERRGGVTEKLVTTGVTAVEVGTF